MSKTDDLLLPEGARLVHIGPHKTGSTAVQVALSEVRSELPAHGVRYPGTAARDRKAGWALGLPGRRLGTPQPPIRMWKRLAAQVAEGGHDRVCVSNEDFGRADEGQVVSIVRDLGGDAVHVVAVARRLDRYLPSQWQERVKAGDPESYDAWLRIVLGDDTQRWNYRNTWQAHDVQALVRRWVEVVGPDRFTLIISDDSDHELLPRTFERMLGLPDGLLKLIPGRSNRGLCFGEVELLRSLNRAFRSADADRAARRAYVDEMVRRFNDLPAEQRGPRRPALPGWALERVRELSDLRADAVSQMDVRVVGDPELLRVPPSVTSAESQEQVVVPVQLAASALEAALTVALGQGEREEALEIMASVPAAADDLAARAHWLRSLRRRRD